MLQAGSGVAFLEFAQVQSGAKVRAFAVDHRRAHAGGQLFEEIAQGQDQAVGQRVALGAARETQDRDLFFIAANL
ncbi:hypothetical protein D3C71_1781310 [compost metagenome]